MAPRLTLAKTVKVLSGGLKTSLGVVGQMGTSGFPITREQLLMVRSVVG